MPSRKQSAATTEIELSAHKFRARLPADQAASIGAQLRELVSPFIQAAGLASDYLSFFRQKAALKSLKRVHRLAKEQGITLGPIAPRFLVPWIDSVSLDDPNSGLADMWARLLLGASSAPELAQPLFVVTLKRLDGKAAKELEAMWSPYKSDSNSLSPQIETMLSISVAEREFNEALDAHCRLSSISDKSAVPGTRDSKFAKRIDRSINQYLDALHQIGVRPIFIKLRVEVVDANVYFEYEKHEIKNARSISILAAANCVQEHRKDFHREDGGIRISGYIRCHTISSYGHDFMQACHSLALFAPKGRVRPTIQSHGFIDKDYWQHG